MARGHVRFAPSVRTHSKLGSGLEPLAPESSPRMAHRSHPNMPSDTLSWGTTGHLGSANGVSGNMYAARYQAPTRGSGDTRIMIHPVIMSGMSPIDLGSLHTTTDPRLRQAAFPETWNKHVQLHLVVHGVTVHWGSVSSTDNQPLTVSAVLNGIKAALQLPTVLPPGHPLSAAAAAACARRGGRTVRKMDLYGPADTLLLMGLVERRDGSGAVYFDADILPWSYTRA
ncbi:hypothetical protein L226DRAFT_526561 [Lentinus tigrinus ALCF2SS1-7]|uniref:Uncharacterized protein n=1 Tax=Lentinus tigrinus ALCF2SS1-6 TaxID=1328759 RepID=A0A5C2S971_9APHY|nr:hypothetical protein L227DRAFT_611254 [Lentinus tigrinus ALCF2SS1-6]RPD69554.1 hypothetical protein L226DRAFT_526561 [Lentinus tigrinus ALCF2SS1-7]